MKQYKRKFNEIENADEWESLYHPTAKADQEKEKNITANLRIAKEIGTITRDLSVICDILERGPMRTKAEDILEEFKSFRNDLLVKGVYGMKH